MRLIQRSSRFTSGTATCSPVSLKATFEPSYWYLLNFLTYSIPARLRQRLPWLPFALVSAAHMLLAREDFKRPLTRHRRHVALRPPVSTSSTLPTASRRSASVSELGVTPTWTPTRSWLRPMTIRPSAQPARPSCATLACFDSSFSPSLVCLRCRMLEDLRHLGWHYIDHEKLQTAEKYGPWEATLVDNVVLSLGMGFVGTEDSTSGPSSLFVSPGEELTDVLLRIAPQ